MSPMSSAACSLIRWKADSSFSLSSHSSDIVGLCRVRPCASLLVRVGQPVCTAYAFFRLALAPASSGARQQVRRLPGAAKYLPPSLLETHPQCSTSSHLTPTPTNLGRTRQPHPPWDAQSRSCALRPTARKCARCGWQGNTLTYRSSSPRRAARRRVEEKGRDLRPRSGPPARSPSGARLLGHTCLAHPSQPPSRSCEVALRPSKEFPLTRWPQMWACSHAHKKEALQAILLDLPFRGSSKHSS